MAGYTSRPMAIFPALHFFWGSRIPSLIFIIGIALAKNSEPLFRRAKLYRKGFAGVAGAVAGGASVATGFAKCDLSIFGLISTLSTTSVWRYSVPGLPWSILNGNFNPSTSR